MVEVEVPRTVQLYAPVVTKDNVDQYLAPPSSPEPGPRVRVPADPARSPPPAAPQPQELPR